MPEDTDPDPSHPVSGEALAIGVETQVWTESSVWFFRPGLYLRTPRFEAWRAQPHSPRLRDDEWMQMTAVIWETDGEGLWWLRVRPVAGPTGGHGIGTGLVQRVVFR